MRLLIGLLLLAAATLIRPAAAPPTQSAQPWPPSVVKAVALGRQWAGADVAWLQVVQLVGSPRSHAAGYPFLDEWVNTVTQLDPGFEIAYFFGAVLLVTDRARGAHMDSILARGEAAIPDSHELPLLRAFIAHFGTLAMEDAAAHYERASQKPTAPAYIKGLAQRLRESGMRCEELLAQLKTVGSGTSSARLDLLRGEQGTILENCVRTRIESAAASYRIETGKSATIEELVAAGRIAEPLHPPGRCWKLDGASADLVPCNR